MNRHINKLFFQILLNFIGSEIVFAIESPFDLSMYIVEPIVVSESQSLTFPSVIQGVDSTITVAPEDAVSAVFTVSGALDAVITASVVEDIVMLTTSSGGLSSEQIEVDSWKFGGDLLDVGSSGVANLQGGFLSDLRIGATAKILAEDVVGDYAGTATFRVVYQ